MFITDREIFFQAIGRVLTTASMPNKVWTAEERSTAKKPPNRTQTKTPLHMWNQTGLPPHLTEACWEHRGCRLAPIGSARPNLVDAQPFRLPVPRQPGRVPGGLTVH